MPDFKLIMTGWKDICKRHDSCDECPIRDCIARDCRMLENLSGIAINSIERDVLKETPVWKEHSDLNPLNAYYECSACGCRSATQSRYCPDCGRKLLLG